MTAFFDCVNIVVSSQSKIRDGCHSLDEQSPPRTFLGALEQKRGLWVQQAEVYPLGSINDHARHSECQAGAHFLSVVVSIADCVRDSGGRKLKPSKFVKCYECNLLENEKPSAPQSIAETKRNVIAQSILCSGRLPLVDQMEHVYEIPLFTTVEVGSQSAVKAYQVGKVQLNLTAVRSDSHSLNKAISHADSRFCSNPQLDSIIDAAVVGDSISDSQSTTSVQLEDYLVFNKNSQDLLLRMINLLLYCCEKLNQLDLLQSGENNEETPNKVPEALAHFQGQVFATMLEVLARLCCPLYTEPSGVASIIAIITIEVDVKNVFIKGANYFLEVM